MSKITEAMVEAAKSAYWHEVHNGGGYSDKCYEAAISAALSAMQQPQWNPVESAPKDGFFLAWSPDHPELVMTWKAEIFHQARTPGTPRHLSANHFTLWMPIPLPGGANG